MASSPLGITLLLAVMASAATFKNVRPTEPWPELHYPPEGLSASSFDEGAARETLTKDGMVHIKELVSPVVAEALLRFINESYPSETASSHTNLQLPLLSPVQDALHDALAVVAPLLIKELGNPYLFELASLINDAGATRQPTHADFFDEPDQPPKGHMLSLLVALQNITFDMGPTEILPGTHTREMLSRLCPAECDEEKIASERTIGAAMTPGSALLLDSRILHRGGPNQTPLRRAYLWISFLDPSTPTPSGSPPTIVSPYLSKFPVQQWKKWTSRTFDAHDGADTVLEDEGDETSGTAFSPPRDVLERYLSREL